MTETTKIKGGYKARRFIANAFIYVLLAVLGIIWVSPLFYMVLHSFRAEGLSSVPYLIPKSYPRQLHPVIHRYC
jgi:arabinogalactan oligomer/maltooligosaccharide transport system permease protein